MVTANQILTTLAGITWVVGPAPATAQIVGDCESLDPAGYFTGVATSQQSGRLDVSLNLRCSNGRYAGELATPMGSFGITGGSGDSNHLHLDFAIGTEVGRI